MLLPQGERAAIDQGKSGYNTILKGPWDSAATKFSTNSNIILFSEASLGYLRVLCDSPNFAIADAAPDQTPQALQELIL